MTNDERDPLRPDWATICRWEDEQVALGELPPRRPDRFPPLGSPATRQLVRA